MLFSSSEEHYSSTSISFHFLIPALSLFRDLVVSKFWKEMNSWTVIKESEMFPSIPPCFTDVCINHSDHGELRSHHGIALIWVVVSKGSVARCISFNIYALSRIEVKRVVVWIFVEKNGSTLLKCRWGIHVALPTRSSAIKDSFIVYCCVFKLERGLPSIVLPSASNCLIWIHIILATSLQVS